MDAPIRTCIGCAQTDDHPRHVIDVGGGQSVNWHMDCHKIATDCEVCTEQIAGQSGVTGAKLRAHLVKTGPSPAQPGWTSPAIDGEFVSSEIVGNEAIDRG